MSHHHDDTEHHEHHYVHRIGWLRAAVLGANDGIVSTASLIVGVAAASADRETILIAGIAGLVAGATAMAAGEYVWPQQAGPTVFAPFQADTDYFPADKQWMLNLRVDDLDGLLAKLRAAGIEIITKAEWDTPETGRFAQQSSRIGIAAGRTCQIAPPKPQNPKTPEF